MVATVDSCGAEGHICCGWAAFMVLRLVPRANTRRQRHRAEHLCWPRAQNCFYTTDSLPSCGVSYRATSRACRSSIVAVGPQGRDLQSTASRRALMLAQDAELLLHHRLIAQIQLQLESYLSSSPQLNSPIAGAGPRNSRALPPQLAARLQPQLLPSAACYTSRPLPRPFIGRGPSRIPVPQ